MIRTVATLLGVTGLSVGLATAKRNRIHRLSAPELSAPVTISRDAKGIPLISAGSRDDALFGLGYAVAQDRLFQMDTLRRTAFGRLSELAGAATLESDKMMRLIDMQKVADDMLACAVSDARSNLESFAAGVNLMMSQGRLPLEFQVLRYRPEPWRPQDSAAIVRLMGWTLSAFHTHDLTVALLRETMGDEWADAIAHGRSPESPPVVREPSPLLGKTRDRARPVTPFPHGGASNAWAVSGDRSMTGMPILANDPHLGYSNPSIWCEASIDAPGFQVSGFTLPGTPGLAIGRTPTFAWGLTAAMISQTFMYRELIDNHRNLVATGEDWSAMTNRTEEIAVKGSPSVVLQIRSTPRGPLLSDIQPEWSSDAVSLYWTGAETHPDELNAWMALSSIGSVDDVYRIREAIIAPTLNMAAADSDGNIATIGIGRWPDQAPVAGLLQPTAHPPSYIPPADVPVELNPSRGWIASANNRIAGSEYPYSLHGFYEPIYRINRITDALDSRPKHSIADMRALQLDQYSLHASELTRFLLDLGAASIPDWARRELSDWDFNTPPESRATLLFQTFYRQWVIRSLSHRLPDRVVDKLLDGIGIGDLPMGFCDRLLKGELSEWWLDDGRARTVSVAFNDALVWISDRLGSDHQSWTWGAVHSVTWAHPFGLISGPHQRFVNVGPFPVGGDRTTVWPTGFHSANLFDVVAGPSMRMIADMRRFESTWATNTLGQQGRPLGRHYRDQTSDFLTGSMHAVRGQPTKPRVVIEPR